jgi:hypothetical protein
VAELADAQVSEACDGDIVEVQVLSSAPIRNHTVAAGLLSGPAVLAFYMYLTPASNTLEPVKIFVTDFRRPVFSN